MKYNYSNKSVRFYSERTDQDDVFQDIYDCWQALDKESVTICHTKEFSVDPKTGIWSMPQQFQKGRIQVVNPNLSRISSKLVELSFSDENGAIQKIESPFIDIDFEKQNLLVWTTTPFELYIFHYG